MKKIVVFLTILLIMTACKPKTYTVTFVDDNQKLMTIEVKKGSSINNVTPPSKDGYLFLNWLKDGLEYNTNNPVNEDMTLEATWTEIPNPTKSYTVTFNFGDKIKTVSVKEGEKVAIPKTIPKKEKHKFLGWYIGEEIYDFDLPVTKDLVIAAKFEKNRIIIDYDLDGGTGTVQVEIEKGTIPDKPKTPLKFGYTFTKWTIDGEEYNFDKPINNDTTIKAIYVANVYVKVTFDTAGGEEVNSQMIVSGTTIKALPIPKKEGYTFKYWLYNDEQFNPETKICEDITLLAKYEETIE